MEKKEVFMNFKKLIPFATSGSSTIEQSVEYLRKTYPSLKWENGKLMNK